MYFAIVKNKDTLFLILIFTVSIIYQYEEVLRKF